MYWLGVNAKGEDIVALEWGEFQPLRLLSTCQYTCDGDCCYTQKTSFDRSLCCALQTRVSGAANGGGLSREEARLLIRAEMKRAGMSEKITRQGCSWPGEVI